MSPTTAIPRTRQLPGWFLAAAAVWCLAAALIPWAVVRAWGSSLPDPVATHWGPNGRPDGFAELTTVWVFPLIFTCALAAFLLGLGAALRQLRALVPVTAGMATFVGSMTGFSIASQAGQLAQESSSDWSVVMGLLAGLAVGGLWALAQRVLAPRPQLERRPGTQPPRSSQLAVADDTRVSWVGTTRTSRASRAAVWLGALAFGVPVVVFGAYRQWIPAALMLTLGATLGVVVHGILHATVIMDHAGVRVRIFDRVTVLTVPLGQIESADVVDVHWGDFGGIGLRARIATDGSWGLVTSSGEGVRVHRVGTGPLFITVSPAAEAASALNTLVARDTA